jgi:hypothetical protein
MCRKVAAPETVDDGSPVHPASMLMATLIESEMTAPV